MANNLTGDYKAVLQISVRQINGILATLHQNSINKEHSPSFPHKASIRIGDVPFFATPRGGQFLQWANKAVRNLQAAGGSGGNARAVLTNKTPAGVAGLFEETFRDLDRFPFGDLLTVRGQADVQISAPKITFSPGAVSEVTVHAFVRAHFYPDAGFVGLPSPLHGEVQAVYRANVVTLPDGTPALRVQVSPDDQQIRFIPEPGTALTPADVQEIAGHVRTALRKEFKAADVRLADDFAFSEFAALGTGPTQALVLPLQLSGGSLPAGKLSSVTNHFLGSDEFAIAASREYLQVFIDGIEGAIKGQAAQMSTPSLMLTASKLSVAWKSGAIDLAGRIDIVTPWPAPDGFISFKQSVTIELDAPSQSLSIKPLGDPDVDESWWLPHGFALTAVRSARDNAIQQASGTLNQSFGGVIQKLVSALKKFDDSASARYTGIELTPDGIVGRGSIGTRARMAPVVDYGPIEGGNAFSAFRSWIPGGQIQLYDWSWVESDPKQPLAWFDKTKRVMLTHVFECLKPSGAVGIRGVCLQIQGTQCSPDGRDLPVTAGEVCTPSSPGPPLLTFPPWWIRIMMPHWGPRPPGDFILDDFISCHINALAGTRTPGSLTTNTIVQFTGPEIEKPLESLGRAVFQMKRRNAPTQIVLVLPVGSFKTLRSELERRLGSFDERPGGELLITEDYAGGWSQTFAAKAHPSTHIINARGEVVWGREGRLDPGVLTRALDDHAIEAPGTSRVPLRLEVRAGDKALDALFTDIEGNQLSFRRLRGRRVLLVFWQSWSTPCIRELQRLQDLRNEGDETFILAVNGGETPQTLADLRRSRGFTYPLIQDPDQQIATLYDVSCWPTTVSINEEGFVDSIQFGMTHEQPAGPEGRG